MYNHLKNETSPYLLQHAENPVNWYPWCDEAFEKAETENKPIFLSIGYSTCHWCHVMAHESFESQVIADYLNKNYVCIKVDREERPDIDQVYMKACQAASGSGGWPASIFMKADKKPFFAGTYFPPNRFLQILKALHSNWQSNYSLIIESSRQIEEIIQQMTSHTPNSQTGENKENILAAEALKSFRVIFDKQYGGFGNAPKFPSPHNLLFLLGNTPDMAEKTLLQMYKGGIFDHIGGGFSRYSTDRKWLVPHFEKMLYDNALITMASTMAYAKTGKNIYKLITEKTFAYLKREMLSPEGCFYAAQDADSDGIEGKYYVFTPSEVISVLGEKDGREFCLHYDITASGNWEEKNIPNLLNRDSEELETEKFEDAKLKLLEFRKQRASLHTDKKLLTSWNALAAASFAFAGRIFDNKIYIEDSGKIIDFTERKLRRKDTLFSGITSGRLISPGFLDDYAFYIFALIQQYKSTDDPQHLDNAAGLMKKALEDFADHENGGFYFSGTENETLIAPVKETYDGAMPSGNSVMMYNMLFLIDAVDSPEIKNFLPKHREFMQNAAANYPAGYCFYLFSLFPVKKIICRDNVCQPTDEDIL